MNLDVFYVDDKVFIGTGVGVDAKTEEMLGADESEQAFDAALDNLRRIRDILGVPLSFYNISDRDGGNALIDFRSPTSNRSAPFNVYHAEDLKDTVYTEISKYATYPTLDEAISSLDEDQVVLNRFGQQVYPEGE